MRAGWMVLVVLGLPAGLGGQGSGDRCAGAPAAATVFAPALADSGRLFRSALSPDGQTLYYFKKVTPGREDYRIFVSRWRGGDWTAGERLDLGGDYSDLYPTLSRDGGRLVFASYRPAPGDTAATPNAYLWYADRQGGGFGPPVFIAAAAEFGTYHSGPVIGADSTIEFHRTSADWRTTWSKAVRWANGRYEVAALQEDPAEAWREWRKGELHVWGAQRSPAGDFAVLDVSEVNPATRRPGPPDVWITRWEGGRWTEPVRAGGGINSAESENFVTFHPNGCELLFTRGFTRFWRVGLAAALAPPVSR